MDRFLQNVVVVRLIAFILAIILWFAVGSGGGGGTTEISPTYSKSFTGIQVSVINDSNQYVVSNSVSKVNVIVTGGTFDITQLQTSLFSIKAVADIRGYSSGLHQVAISLQNVPDTVHYQVIPDVTTVTIEQKVTKAVHVKVGIVGQPGNGYTADSPVLNISAIHVTGPQDRVNKVVAVQAIVSVEGADKTIQQSVPMVAVDENGRQVDDIELSSRTVDVTISVHTPTKDLTLKPVTTGNVKSGYMINRISVSPDHVTVSAPPNVLANLGTNFTLPSVDVSGLDQDKTFTVLLQKPDGVTNVQPSSAIVTVNVTQTQSQTQLQPQPQSQSLTFSVPVSFSNVPDGMNANLQENFTNVDITVTSATAQLGNLTLDSLQVFANLSGLNSGVHAVILQAKVPDGIQVAGISPSSVHVNVTPKS